MARNGSPSVLRYWVAKQLAGMQLAPLIVGFPYEQPVMTPAEHVVALAASEEQLPHTTPADGSQHTQGIKTGLLYSPSAPSS